MMLSTFKRGCANHPDNFCYVCGEYTPLADRVKVNSRIKNLHTSTILHAKWATKTKNGPHISAVTVAEQVFYFG